jgi:hypothetical protein
MASSSSNPAAHEPPKAQRPLIVSQNVKRRQLNKGQAAMAVAFAYPEPEKGGRGKKGKSAETAGFSQTRLRQARYVLRHAPELARRVLTIPIPSLQNQSAHQQL